jgi:hypothetical protein
MSELPHHPKKGDIFDLASAVRSARRNSLHAMHALEYALCAPVPRRHRTWLHRVTAAVDALRAALDTQLDAPRDGFIDLLAEAAMSEPDYVVRIQRLQQELLDLNVALPGGN